MASYPADQVRAVAIELRNKVNTLYVSVLPIFRAAAQWTLNGIDPELPAPFDVSVQLASYKALTITRLKLDEWITAMLNAAPGDTLTYPTPPSRGLLILDGTVQFTPTTIF